MIKTLVDPDGGELGEATGNTKIEMIPFLVMKVAEIFSSLREIKAKNRILSYCIQFNPNYKTTVEAMLINIEHEGMPCGTTFYECDGKRLFEMRGAGGGIVYAMCFYVITKLEF